MNTSVTLFNHDVAITTEMHVEKQDEEYLNVFGLEKIANQLPRSVF